MKRALLENNRVVLEPGIVDRNGFLSAVYALKASGEIAEGTTASVTVTHCDTADGEFVPVADAEVYQPLWVDGKKPGKLEGIRLAADEDINIDVDLLGCKRFVKFTPSFSDKDGGAAEVTHVSALVLGDSTGVPV